MAKKTSIYLPTIAQEITESYGAKSLSGTITTIIDRYRRIITDNTPDLTEAEWSAIVDALNGAGVWMSAGGPDLSAMIWAEIADSDPNCLNEKWGISCRELAAKLKDLPLAGRIACWDVAARFWASPKLNDMATRGLLLESGAKIK